MSQLKNIQITLIGATVLTLFLLTACSKTVTPRDFTIIGTWGMVSGEITDADGKITRYDPIGTYYQFLEFKPYEQLIKTELPGRKEHTGRYYFNTVTGELMIKYDNMTYAPLTRLTIVSLDEIIIHTDYGSLGLISQRFIRIKHNYRKQPAIEQKTLYDDNGNIIESNAPTIEINTSKQNNDSK